MKTILTKHDYREAAAKLEGVFPARTHVDKTINEDTMILTLGARITALFLKQRIDPTLCEKAFAVWIKVNELVERTTRER